MGRSKKPIASPLPRDPYEAWGDVPSDKRSERKRLARIVAGNGRRIANYKAFCLEHKPWASYGENKQASVQLWQLIGTRTRNLAIFLSSANKSVDRQPF